MKKKFQKEKNSAFSSTRTFLVFYVSPDCRDQEPRAINYFDNFFLINHLKSIVLLRLFENFVHKQTKLYTYSLEIKTPRDTVADGAFTQKCRTSRE